MASISALRQHAVGLVILLLLAAGCSTSDDASSPSTQSLGETVDVNQVSAELIAALGSDATAANALIIAMDRGYSGAQILRGAETSSLAVDGTIDGEQPVGSALNLVLYDLSGAGEGATGDNASGDDVVLVSFFQVQKTPIEQLRENATRNLGVGEPATRQILALLRAGFEAADVVEILILGIDGYRDYPDEPDSPILCIVVVDELYCPFGERFRVPGEDAPSEDTSGEPRAAASDEQDLPSGPITFSGSASQGAIENENSNDLRSAEFTATIEGSTVVMDVTMIVHAWHRGGYEEQFVDQNCGSTYRHVLRFEGPTGNPTVLRAVVLSSEILEVQGALCDDDDAERDLLTAGETQGRFEGKANGLGIDGVLEARSLPLEISAS